ncbi:toll/interleukin-1 receptor domain-containing protein [Rhodococcus sp. ABRD24]|uniref:toll/interleukin-1 receptor domain-containing protein n=1 Tax=Rhodococcus sp. ABRD24 TaxID=2507582 RepID=UPI0013F15359|nr:toll/interleukin-1 receptor domain-containing protein [Rhodococcus sp. ABRD24]
MLDPKVRIELLFQVVEELENLTSDREDIVLQTYGIEPRRFEGFGPGSTLAEAVNSASDDQVLALARQFDIDTPQVDAPVAVAHSAARSAEPLFMFASHLTTHRALVAAVANRLERYNITLFVAHDSIAVDNPWAAEIENALDRADAGVVFVHDGFKQSDWCDQEVGWMLGRKIPVFAFMFDATAYGPLGQRQAEQVRGAADPTKIAESIVDRAKAKPELVAGLTASLVNAISASGSFATTDAVWARLRELRSLDSGQCAQLLEATKTNTQIYRAVSKVPADARERYTTLIAKFLRQQPGGSTIMQDIEAYEQYLRDRDAAQSKPLTKPPVVR